MARKLYNYWFVQFDFPDEDGNPYKSSGGKMVWNEKLKREIPPGWKVVPINSLCEIKSGFPFKSDTYVPNGAYRIVTIRNVQDHTLDLSSTESIDIVPDKLPDYCYLSIGDCLISLTGNVGRICRVDSEGLLLNQRVGVIIDRIGFPEWIYSLFDKSSVVKQILLLANGCAQANVSPVDIGNIHVELPSNDILKAYSQAIVPIRQLQMKTKAEIAQLSLERNELLPLLMNGQVSVKQLNNHFAERNRMLSSAFSKLRLYERSINPKNRGRDERFPLRRSDGAAARGY